jgi:hypothetical protein
MSGIQKYNFPESLVADALHHYTMVHCYGECDEEFYYELCVKTFFDNALETCIVLDYLEEVYKDFMEATPLVKDIMKGYENGNSSKR